MFEIVPALLTVLVPFTRTLVKLGFVPALVWVEATDAPLCTFTVSPLTPVGAMKAADEPVQFTVWPFAGTVGVQSALAPLSNAAQAGTLSNRDRRSGDPIRDTAPPKDMNCLMVGPHQD
ncbi:hypothetical protein [uncultured Methylobacterium sp.]|uniref:hypothetical protein n=1 Tax=uncultured Methylobacterium sp. TaxID=157278 RepID=UPI002593C507|nr:hypothetical protein [uncultured Methylobacterium sp.]